MESAAQVRLVLVEPTHHTHQLEITLAPQARDQICAAGPSSPHFQRLGYGMQPQTNLSIQMFSREHVNVVSVRDLVLQLHLLNFKITCRESSLPFGAICTAFLTFYCFGNFSFCLNKLLNSFYCFVWL